MFHTGSSINAADDPAVAGQVLIAVNGFKLAAVTPDGKLNLYALGPGTGLQLDPAGRVITVQA